MEKGNGHLPDDPNQGDLEGAEYDRLAELEDLESLLEEMEEAGVANLDQPANVPADIRERMEEYGVRDVQQVRDRIMHLHAQIDDDEDDPTISDS